MTAKVIILKDYLGGPKKRKRKAAIDRYALWVQITIDSEGRENIEYDVSDKLFDTGYGRELLTRHLGSIVLDLCNDDNPELVAELLEILSGEDDE